MRFTVYALLLLCCGCVPLAEYQRLERNLSAVAAERNELTKDLAVCEEQKKHLKEVAKKQAPVRYVPAVDAIDQTQLDEIKKKALSEAEQKYRQRIERGKLKR